MKLPPTSTPTALGPFMHRIPEWILSRRVARSWSTWLRHLITPAFVNSRIPLINCPNAGTSLVLYSFIVFFPLTCPWSLRPHQRWEVIPNERHERRFGFFFLILDSVWFRQIGVLGGHFRQLTTFSSCHFAHLRLLLGCPPRGRVLYLNLLS